MQSTFCRAQPKVGDGIAAAVLKNAKCAGKEFMRRFTGRCLVSHLVRDRGGINLFWPLGRKGE